ncbi:MAG: DUF1501 domain-containing protein [Pirellulales bacterium]|nr:DUF1501 domain-containing protein [Pirellulales bacterium]
MLTFLGRRQKFCDGVSRRDFLKIGSMATGSLAVMGASLADVYRAEATPVADKLGGLGNKSIINIFLAGGPSHIDMFDMKPEAPPEIRGEFNPSATNIPGIEINSLMPQLAKLADKFAVIRSLTGIRDEHSSWQTETGFSENDLKSSGGHPSLGAVVAKMHGPTNGPVPRFVDLTGHTQHGFLGAVYAGFRPDGNGRENLRMRGEIGMDRLNDRAKLLGEIDRIRRDVDNSRMMEAMDSFNQRAIDVITGSKMADALKIEDESQAVKEEYGLDTNGGGDNQRFLLSRKLIEAGVRCVSFSWGGWDTHERNFVQLRDQLPRLDHGLGALIRDLDQRGMLADTAIVMWGEFGRTPRVNGSAGRDHWSRSSSCFLAGGGLKTGQVIGSTSRYGEAPQDRPVHLHEVFATLYHLMGIDAKNTTLIDNNGRPQYLVEHPQVIGELV